MKENKNIDRLFQERLKDFEAAPPHAIWNGIESAIITSLAKPKKQKKTYKYASIAAAFIMGILPLKTILNPRENGKSANQFGLVSSKYNQNSNRIFEKIARSSSTQKNKEKSYYYAKTENKIRNSSLSGEKTKETKKKNTNDFSVYIAKNNSPLVKKIPKEEDVFPNKLEVKNNEKQLVATTHLNTDNLKKTTTSAANLAQKNTSIAPKNLASKENIVNEIILLKEAPNALAEVEKEEKITSGNNKKWKITPNFAPIYMNTKNGGSPIDNNLSNNKRTSENTQSYGLALEYAITKKIKIRTGINKISLAYNTNEVQYTIGSDNQGLANIASNGINTIEFIAKNSADSPIKNPVALNSGIINQKMNYLEIPIEMSYALINKKFGIEIIGGLSSFFLNNNSINLITNQTNVSLGEAKNLSNLHFSTNLGLGFKYKIKKNVQLQMEPIAKYQVNAYSKNANSFQPIILGIYSGLSFQF